jgi:hypothetical protein
MLTPAANSKTETIHPGTLETIHPGTLRLLETIV